MPYPDDLDDTCCAMSALLAHDPKNVPTKAIAKVVNLLTFCESREGGPYYTWLAPADADKSWKDIDLAVNSNIAYFLALQEVILPNLVALTEKAIVSEKYYSPYYCSPYATAYFISRWYKGKKKEKIISFLLKEKRKNCSWGNPLETALAVSALINLGYDKEKLEESIGYILKNQVKGEWKAFPLVVEKISKKQKNYSGSRELTTAFCLEALGKFRSPGKADENNKINGIDGKAKKMHKKVLLFANQKLSGGGAEIYSSYLKVGKKIMKEDKQLTVTLLPYYLRKSLKDGNFAAENIPVKLGAASYFGWIAYTIYDDFLDCEGDPKLLPLANACLRGLVSVYRDIFSNDEIFLEFFGDIMDRIDAANAWEAANCRAQIEGTNLIIPDQLPNFGKLEKLADRSIGHALGSVAVLYLNFGNIKSLEIKNLLAFFEHYIIARQLNDDAHDWEGDLKKGQLSPAAVMVLKKYFKRNGNKKNLDLKKEIKDLQKIFWHEVVQEICGQALFHIQAARKNLENISALKDKSFFQSLLCGIEQSSRQAMAEQKEMLEFLEECRQDAG